MKWQVNTNEYNQPFIKCLTSGAVAWFSNDGSLFMFRHYSGQKDTLLYYFFQAVFKVQLGFYKNLEIRDNLPLNHILKNPLLFIQDFVAPFFRFLRSEFSIKYDYIDNEVMTSNIRLESTTANFIGKYELNRTKFSVSIDESGVDCFTVSNGRFTLNAESC